MPEVAPVVGNAREDEGRDLGRAQGFRPRRRREDRRRRHHGGERDRRCISIDGMRGRTRAFVQVQNGCDHRCTFCIIPYGRGNSRSVPMGAVVEQVRDLVEHGSREVVLTGVDITSYGRDLPGAPKLGALVKSILRHVPELERLRLSSIDSVEADDDLLDAFAERSAADAASASLAAGRRRPRPEAHEAPALCAPTRSASATRCARLRPDVVFGADIIAGFPTETEAMFARSPRPRRGMRADASPRLPVLAPARDAGRAHAAGRARRREGARPAPAREGRGGASRGISPARSARAAGARRDRAARPDGRLHPRALRRPGRAGEILEATIAGHDGQGAIGGLGHRPPPFPAYAPGPALRRRSAVSWGRAGL